ncbi:MAG: Oxygen-independent coproporphyrinogen-III oxidase 1 [Deltaproteobacteria bacterium ADurb.Bin510]|nr:MAG: Oxygen-independent coproporphyrinogen-III oxidase 1 [Deltaproteobacteria bacterium ADurb.Bin510]
MRAFLDGCAGWQERSRILAFYGGSFTALESGLLNAYLAVAAQLIESGLVDGFKASTRPDAVDAVLLERLKAAGCVGLELGAQSFDDKVLASSGRGHTAAQTVRAARLIQAAGLELGLQFMPGLPGEDAQSFKLSVEQAVALRPAGFRIYPAVVFAGTRLARFYAAGTYRPLELEQAVRLSLYGATRLSAAGSVCLRLGLPPLMSDRIVAGPYHPAFGELVRSLGFGLMARRLSREGAGPLVVNPADVSALVGYERFNIVEQNFHYVVDAQQPRGGLSRAGEKACLYFSDIIHELI